MPTIIPNVSRSRRSCRISLRAIASARAAGWITVCLPLGGGGHEHVLEARRRHLDARLDTRARQRLAHRARGIPHLRVDQRVQPRAELGDAPEPRQARERRARLAHGGCLHLEHHRADPRGEVARRPLRHELAVVEDRERVAALRLVHVVRGDEDRRAAVDEHEQRLPELAPVLRVDGAGRLVEEQQLGLVDQRGRECEALPLAARERARALIRAVEVIFREQRVDAPAPVRGRQRVDLADEVEVLAHGEILVEREALGHVADLAAQHVRRRAGSRSRARARCPRSAAAGRTASGSWWSCPSRSGPGSRRSGRAGSRGRCGRRRRGSPKRRVRPCASIASSLTAPVAASAVGRELGLER